MQKEKLGFDDSQVWDHIDGLKAIADHIRARLYLEEDVEDLESISHDLHLMSEELNKAINPY